MAPGPAEFALGFSRALGKVVVHVEGALDASTAPQLGDRLTDVIDGQGNRHLVLDLTATTRVDAAGLAVLVRAVKRLHLSGGQLVLSGLSSTVAETFTVAGVDRLFHITPSWEHPAHGDNRTGLGRPVGWA